MNREWPWAWRDLVQIKPVRHRHDSSWTQQFSLLGQGTYRDFGVSHLPSEEEMNQVDTGCSPKGCCCWWWFLHGACLRWLKTSGAIRELCVSACALSNQLSLVNVCFWGLRRGSCFVPARFGFHRRYFLGFFGFGLDSSMDNLAFKMLWLVEPSFSEAPESRSHLQMIKAKQHLSLFCGQKLSAALCSIRAGCILPKSLQWCLLLAGSCHYGWLHVAWGLTASPAFSVVTKRRFPQPRVGLLLFLTHYKM